MTYFEIRTSYGQKLKRIAIAASGGFWNFIRAALVVSCLIQGSGDYYLQSYESVSGLSIFPNRRRPPEGDFPDPH
jgi:hypothetical protein